MTQRMDQVSAEGFLCGHLGDQMSISDSLGAQLSFPGSTVSGVANVFNAANSLSEKKSRSRYRPRN